MTEILNSESGWLNLTNILLGVAVLACIVVVAKVIIQDVRVRVAARSRRPIVQDDHAFTLSSLGITMADGGERIDEKTIKSRGRQTPDDDPPNVDRSDN